MDDLSVDEQEYNPTPIINEVRTYVDTWRNLPSPDQWLVTPETARLLRHWRRPDWQGIRPFFCQVEAVETAIWLVEVAPKMSARTAKFREYLKGANAQANPELMRLALKLATGAGKTTVMAMLIAWQTVNAVRSPNSKAGLVTVDLVPLAGSQRALPGFGASEPAKSPALMVALDACNERFGRGTVVPGSTGFALRRNWSTRFEMRSPRNTTRLDELSLVGAAQ